MDRLAETLREEIKHAKLAPVKFTHEIVEGVPEEAIAEWAKNNNPLLIVMGTRGTDTKERELVGSVTAEVLDPAVSRFSLFLKTSHSPISTRSTEL